MPSRAASAPRLRSIGRLFLLATLASVAVACSDSPTGPGVSQSHEVVLGGLFSTTGNWSTLGKTSSAAMQLAVADVNAALAHNGAGLHFSALIEDTKLDPAQALTAAKDLRAHGAQILVGPQSSAEVAALKPYVDSAGVILVSQSSTAGSLAIAGDNIFRFTPSDTLEGVAVAALMSADGIRTIVPVWRDDAGNAGLEHAARVSFTRLGGSVANGVKYSATATDFTSTVATLTTQVNAAIAQAGASHVAVYLAGFDEVAQLFTSAASVPVLGSVRWYGSDGVARSDVVIANAAAVDFATRVQYPNPIFGLDATARDTWAPIAAKIQTQTQITPDAFALAVYDAVWVAAESYLAAGAKPDIATLKSAFVTAADGHFGATGWTVLNDAGDRKYGDFDFVAIQRGSTGAPTWTVVAQYDTDSGVLTRQ